MRPTEVGFRSPCAASCIFIRSGHFVCRLTSDAKSRAPIKAQRNKGAACLGAGGPPRSRAPFTFVKEINLPLLSAGRGQSGRKRDACCRPGGGGAICPQRQAAASERTSCLPPCHQEKTTARIRTLTTPYPPPGQPRLDPDRALCLHPLSNPAPRKHKRQNLWGTGAEPQEFVVGLITHH